MAEKNFKHLLSLSPPRTGTTYLFDLFASIPQVREKTTQLVMLAKDQGLIEEDQAFFVVDNQNIV